MRLTCRCRMRAANGCGGGRAGAGGGCGARTLADAGAARQRASAQSSPPRSGADGDGREPVRKRRRVGCLRLATRADIERRWGPVGTPAIRAPRADDPPPGCRCRQWRTMAPEEGRGAAARVNTTCSRSTLNGPPGCRGERGMARAAATLGIIGLRWPPRAPPNMLSFAVVTEWPVGVYPHRRRRSPPHARIVRAVDLPTRVCVSWAK